jgi:hypothetical protein
MQYNLHARSFGRAQRYQKTLTPGYDPTGLTGPLAHGSAPPAVAKPDTVAACPVGARIPHKDPHPSAVGLATSNA